ncbi:MAG: hypothetical protein J5846_07760 [Desulfovibrio sp.]|nr:hypothetical protein [Desulfovibrio sp.]
MAEQHTPWHKLPASFWLAAALIWLVMLFFTCLTPLMADNYLFSRNMTPGFAQFMAGAPLASLEPMTLAAAFEQSLCMYKTWCGRFMGNFFVYVSFLLPDSLRQALSAMLFVGLCLLIHVHMYGLAWKEKLKASSLLLIAAFLWLGMPSFGSAFFWVSVGGMPAIVFQLLFLLPYRFSLENKDFVRWTQGARLGLSSFLLFLLGLCCASLDYASSAAMPMAALAGIGLYCRGERQKRTLILLLCGFLGVSLGSALTLLAPGNASRMALSADPEVHAWLASSFGDKVLAYLCHLPMALLIQWLALGLLLWALWVLWRVYQRAFWRHIPLVTVFFLVPFAVTHAAYFFTPWPPARAFATSYVQLFLAAAIAALSAASKQEPRTALALRFLKYCLVLLCMASLVSLCYDGWKFLRVQHLMQQRDALYAEHTGENVRVMALDVQGDTRMVLGYQLQDLDRDPDFWLNRAVAKYWGLKSVAIEDEVPRRFHLALQDTFGKDCMLSLRTEKGRLAVDLMLTSQDEPSYREVSFYYYGKPAMLYLLPYPINDAIAERLGQNLTQSWLVPLLLARTTASLSWSQGEDGRYHARGSAKLWGLCPGSFPFWLVRPGEDELSFSVRFLPESR